METRIPNLPTAARRRRSGALGLALASAVVAAAACHDSPTDPLVGLVAEESYAALALGMPFPDPAAWSARSGLDERTASAVEAWRASWELLPEEGRRAREAAYGPMSRGLAEVLGSADLEGELAVLSGAVARAQALATDQAFPPHVAAGILLAGSALGAAADAEARGDGPAALEALIRGGDALREVGPEAAARALVGEVERRLGSLAEDAPYSEEDLARVGRLARGGRQALEEGDWVLAIRRAFYARGILGGNG